jgi:hypothetical protein
MGRHIHVEAEISLISLFVVFENLNCPKVLIPLGSDINIRNGFYDNMLWNVVKFSNTFVNNIRPALNSTLAEDLDVISYLLLQFPIFLLV